MCQCPRGEAQSNAFVRLWLLYLLTLSAYSLFGAARDKSFSHICFQEPSAIRVAVPGASVSGLGATGSLGFYVTAQNPDHFPHRNYMLWMQKLSACFRPQAEGKQVY